MQFNLDHIELKEDFSKKLKFMHYIAIKNEDGQKVIIWPPRRAGEEVVEVKQ